jgi:hypothetical protein
LIRRNKFSLSFFFVFPFSLFPFFSPSGEEAMRILAFWVVLVCALYAMTLAAGCGPHIDARTLAQINQQHQLAATRAAGDADAAKLKLQKEKERETLNDQRGADAPVMHPIDAANSIVKKIQKPLFAVDFGFLLLFILAFALKIYLPLTLVNLWKIGLRGAALTTAAIIALSFFPGGLLGVAIYILFEWIIHKFNVPATERAIESDFSAAPPTAPPSPASTAAPASSGVAGSTAVSKIESAVEKII